MEENIERPVCGAAFHAEGEWAVPEGYEAEIKDGKIIVRKKESENERIRLTIVKVIKGIREAVFEYEGVKKANVLAYLEKQKDSVSNAKYIEDVARAYADGGRSCAVSFIGFLDKNRYAGKMCVSNPECADIDKAFFEKDWAKVIAYANKYLCDHGKVEEKPGSCLPQEQKPAECSDCKEYDLGFERGREEGVTAGYNKATKEMEQKEQKPAEWSEEDERIRKALIHLISEQDGILTAINGISVGDILAYLEKQERYSSSNFKEAEKEKTAHIGHGFMLCKADYQDFKEGEHYWLEYLGDDKYNVRSDNLLGRTYHITPQALYLIFRPLTWLEKQKDSKWSPSEDEMGVLYKLCYISKQVTDEDDTELTRLYQDLKREYFNGHSFENMFPYEKQKEQNPTDYPYLPGWRKNRDDNKPELKRSVLMLTTHGVAEGEWLGEKWCQYRWSCELKDGEVLYWMHLSDLERLEKEGEEKQKEQKPVEKQDYSGLHDLERAILRGFLAAGVENVPVGIIKETASECIGFLALLDDKPAGWSEEDEKIRSVILHMMKVPRKEIFEARGVTKEQVLDWLERQKKTEEDPRIAYAKSGHACQATAIPKPTVPPWDPETEHQCDCEHVGCHINNCRRWCKKFNNEVPYKFCDPTCSGYSHKNTEGISVKKPTWTGNDSMALVSLEAIINNSNHDEDRKKELLDWLLTRVQNGFSHTPEEKEFVRTIKSLVADFIYQKEGVDTSYYQRLVDWVEKRHIESIEPLWTPTEAQMWALQEAVARSCSSEYGGPLSEMLEMLNRSLGRKTAWEKCKPGATDDNAVAFVYPSPEAWRFANEGTKFSEDMLVVGADREPRMSRCAVNKCYYLPTSKILPPKSVTDKLVAQYGDSHDEPNKDKNT